MAVDKNQVLKEIEATLKAEFNNVETHVQDACVDFSIPMKFTQDGDPSKIHFTSRFNGNFVESYCVMTMDYFDVKPGQELGQDFYSMMNFINATTKGSCSYFLVDRALICSTVTPAYKNFDADVYSFNVYNMVETVGRHTYSFYAILNGHITFQEMSNFYKEQAQAK